MALKVGMRMVTDFMIRIQLVPRHLCTMGPSWIVWMNSLAFAFHSASVFQLVAFFNSEVDPVCPLRYDDQQIIQNHARDLHG